MKRKGEERKKETERTELKKRKKMAEKKMEPRTEKRKGVEIEKPGMVKTS